jgi:hypothetical protein
MLCIHVVFSTTSNVVMAICNLATRSLLYGCLPTPVLTHYTRFAVELQTLRSSMQQWLKNTTSPSTSSQQVKKKGKDIPVTGRGGP